MTSNKEILFATEGMERRLIGAIANAPTMLYIPRHQLDDRMFTGVWADAWKAICSMDDHNEPMEFVTIAAKLSPEAMKAAAEMMGQNISESDIIYITQELRNLWLRGRIYNMGVELINKVANPATGVEALVAMPKNLTDEFSSIFDKTSSTITLPEAVNHWLNELSKQEAALQQGRNIKVATGFGKLDTLLYQGLAPGDLVVIGARPGQGKTAVSLQIARNAAKDGKNVMLFEMEMTPSQIAQRSVLSTGQVVAESLQRGSYDWQALEIATGLLEKYSNITIDNRSRTYDDIVSKIMLAHNNGHCDFAVIDHLGLIRRPNDAKMTVAQQLEEYTTGFKTLAQEAEIPILLLCQLNRDSAKTDREPELQDLRNSGAIEQDADIVLLLQKDKTNDSVVNAYIRKMRQGQGVDSYISLQASEYFTNFREI